MGSSKEEKGPHRGYLAAKEKLDAARQKQSQQAREKYETNPIICAGCKEKVPYEKRKWVSKFCSRKCSAKFNNRVKEKHQVKCLGCEKTFNQRRDKKYCSIKCQQNYIKDDTYKKLLAGENVNIGHDRARNLIIHIYGAKCMECTWDKINLVTGKCPIELEHIDGNSANNKLDNLKLLCPNCHSLTPTYKALNKGKGRYERMKRYNEGKSY
jgi:hypothetical protein